MNYITKSHISEQHPAWGEEMESRGNAPENGKPYNVNTCCPEKDHTVLHNNALFEAPRMSFMADYDFSPTGEILTVRYELVYDVPTRRSTQSENTL